MRGVASLVITQQGELGYIPATLVVGVLRGNVGLASCAAGMSISGGVAVATSPLPEDVTTDEGIVPFVRQPPPPLAPDSQRPVERAACLLNGESLRIHVPLFMRPWVVQAWNFTASCHL